MVMYKRSLWISIIFIGVVFASSFFGQMMVAGQLPSAYDPGLAVEDAFKTSEKPLLIEFYTDTCSACKGITPLVHRVYENNFDEQLTLVMVDVDNPKNRGIAQLFAIDSVPALFVFDHKNMKKEAIPYDELHSPPTIKTAIILALNNIKTRIKTEPRASRPPMLMGQ